MKEGEDNPGCVQSALMVPLGLYIIVGSQRPVLCLGVGVLVHVIGFGVGINLVLRAGRTSYHVGVLRGEYRVLHFSHAAS